MSALLWLPKHGAATKCTAAGRHAPTPLRFVWHHVLPETCGGATDDQNVVAVCDSCHYAIHALLFVLKRDGGSKTAWHRHGSPAQRKLAQRGYDLAVARGTVALIPNEGSILSTVDGETFPPHEHQEEAWGSQAVAHPLISD